MKKRRSFKFALLLALCLCTIPVVHNFANPQEVQAASTFTGWKKGSDGYWYYYEQGKMQTGWLDQGGKRYYLSPDNGRMYTSVKKINGSYYYFDYSGAMQKSIWVKKARGKYYYFSASGRGCTNRWLKSGTRYYYAGADALTYTGAKTIGKSRYYFNADAVMQTGWVHVARGWYYFNSRGVRQTGWLNNYKDNTYHLAANGVMDTGWQTIDGNKYYFHTAKTAASGSPEGAMCKGWLKLSGKRYYLGTNGVMQTGWLTLNGDTYYLKVDGTMKTGLGTKDGKYYYFELNGKMVKNTTKVISGISWKFDENGVGTKMEHTMVNGYVRVFEGSKYYDLEPEFLTHPKVSDDELMAAVLYAESGDQGLAGMTAVAMTIYNRMDDPDFPSSLAYNIYWKNQYAVVPDGALLRRLKDANGAGAAQCRQAVKNAKAIRANHNKTGANRVISGLTMPSGKKDFDCLFFMTHAAFDRLGLNADKCGAFRHKGHTFFTYWKY